LESLDSEIFADLAISTAIDVNNFNLQNKNDFLSDMVSNSYTQFFDNIDDHKISHSKSFNGNQLLSDCNKKQMENSSVTKKRKISVDDLGIHSVVDIPLNLIDLDNGGPSHSENISIDDKTLPIFDDTSETEIGMEDLKSQPKIISKVPKSPPKDKFCDLCNISIYSPFYARHMRDTHFNDGPPYSCEFCKLNPSLLYLSS